MIVFARILRWLAIALLAVPFFLGAVAFTLFVVQGGFGAGHGDHDRTLYLLALPAIDWIPEFQLLESITRSDLARIVVCPMILNLAVIWAPPAALLLLLSHKIAMSRV